jgi:co-chaperonin GroES (HSP10)
LISGTSITRESTDFIPVEAKIRPLGDRIIIRPLDDNLSESIIAMRDGRPIRGKVLAVGPGAYRKRYKKSPCGKFTVVTHTSDFIPMTVKVGDVVQLGGLNVFDGKGYIFEELNWGLEKCLWISEKDVCGIEQ